MSFKITAHTIAEARSDLKDNAGVLDGILLQHPVITSHSTLEERPWVQLAYHEIADHDLEDVLSYAGITEAGSPIGVPCPIEPVHRPPDLLLFSTQHLRSFIEAAFEPLLNERRRFAEFEAFLESRDISPLEYLATSVVECTSWCEARGHAMTIRW